MGEEFQNNEQPPINPEEVRYEEIPASTPEDHIGDNQTFMPGESTSDQQQQESTQINASNGDESLQAYGEQPGRVPQPSREHQPRRERKVDTDALLAPIPNMDEARRIKIGYGDVPIDTSAELYEEPIVSLAGHGISGQAYYSKPHELPNGFHLDPVPGVEPDQYLRRSVAETLAQLKELVKEPEITDFFGGEVSFYVEDALRPISLQQKLHDEVFPRLIRDQHPGISDDDVENRRSELIAKPSNDPNRPSPHATGGAFDIALHYTADGSSVEMGHFDGNVQATVNPDYFETHEPTNDQERLAQRNRRAFYAIMTGSTFGIETGFVNNPTEFWHWGRGDQLSARVSGIESAVYSLAEPNGRPAESSGSGEVEASIETIRTADFINKVMDASKGLDEAILVARSRYGELGVRRGETSSLLDFADKELSSLIESVPPYEFAIDNQIVLEQLFKPGSLGSINAVGHILKDSYKFPGITFDAKFANELLDTDYLSGAVAENIDKFTDLTPAIYDRLIESSPWAFSRALQRVPYHALNAESAEKFINQSGNYFENIINNPDKFTGIDWNSMMSRAEIWLKEAREATARSRSSLYSE